jgi:cyclic beta-1,2-glucan synthetase
MIDSPAEAAERMKYMLVPVIKKQLARMQWWRSASGNSLPMLAEEPPLRAELFSVDHLERHARVLAAEHVLLEKQTVDKLLPRLAENEQVLIDTYDVITQAAENNRRIAPAAEWLLDNFYLIEEQIHSTRRLLPKSYSGELPRLAQGVSAEYPRVYAIALELISHTDGRVDAAGLEGFIASYQAVVPLKLGELWALPLMLRLALIENLRRVATRITRGRADRDLATHWAELLIQVVEERPSDMILVLADMARANPPLSGAFLAEFTRHLQGMNPNFAFVNSWLEHRLADLGQTTEQLVLAEGQAQAADQVSVGNSITSLRFLSVYDWPKFVSAQSLVEQTLNNDPAGVYAKMDFATRDRYRHAVEGIAKRSQISEYEVAHRSVQLAQTAVTNRAQERTTHVGYYLVDRGRPALERLVEMRLTPSVILEKVRRSFPLCIYLLLVCLVAAWAMTIFWAGTDWQAESRFVGCLIALPLAMCGVQLGIAMVNWLASVWMSPQPLPRLDFRTGIPPEYRTLVAVPTMLTSAGGIERLLEGLEIRYLSNRDPCLHFALLTDLTDADEATLPQDEGLVRLASEGIERLNDKHAHERSDTFYLLHRNRRWNAGEQVWMGYERKRGKLADLNATLRGATGRFGCVVGDLTALADVRYVITLDTDTQLPRDAARGLVGAMAHTLNRPVLDSAGRRVIDGYTILQPRVGVSLPSSQRSWFVRLFGGDAGVDPYTRVVSDLYQDLFHEGSFIGKGIYDVDSFEQSCGNFPENAILSHDLLESCYGRSALLSDVILYEDFPASYAADVGRRHRWMRGDWQIAAWLLPRVRSFTARSAANPISALAWWKIFDNLRRSMMPVAMLMLLLSVWLVGSWELAVAASLFVVAIVVVPPMFQVLFDLAHKPTDLPLRTHLGMVFFSLGRPLAQCLFTLVFIPYDAYLSCDAILRTLVRVHWTKRKLLEWKTSSDSESSARGDLPGFYRTMLFAPLVSILVSLWLMNQGSRNLFVALPLLLIWSLSPLVAWWLSRHLVTSASTLTRSQQRFLRHLARKTWRYFEMFVTKTQNWLPPDNVQTNSGELIASPRRIVRVLMVFTKQSITLPRDYLRV